MVLQQNSERIPRYEAKYSVPIKRIIRPWFLDMARAQTSNLSIATYIPSVLYHTITNTPRFTCGHRSKRL